MSNTTCKKVYTDIPWAHRQHRHDGHCAFIHGHNWSIGVTFGCTQLDENGFVVDFGKLKFLKDWINDRLDHACVFNREDPLKEALVAVGGAKAWKIYVVECCSCEGMAKHIFEVFDELIRQYTQDRAYVVSVEVVEDSKNSARYTGDL
ncbi:6-pyruvoyl trahydropterin synthase family protein [Lacunisphaera limnophila]|uniref:6-pyruvoyl trahydropterin synthase family protein n=1 Tax=Lacunisphaera limnophila TaxID=1838286 RepID=UPI0009F6A5C7|nr:6-carboxytetrahydropterin synthase [Lacunisphaera limnophila]